MGFCSCSEHLSNLKRLINLLDSIVNVVICTCLNKIIILTLNGTLECVSLLEGGRARYVVELI